MNNILILEGRSSSLGAEGGSCLGKGTSKKGLEIENPAKGKEKNSIKKRLKSSPYQSYHIFPKKVSAVKLLKVEI
jgi:hypothetical protein